MEAEASSRDLLQRFAGSTTLSDRPPPAPAAVKAADDVELSLGLSLGGCFSANPRENTKLIRSSSISSFPFLDAVKDENFTVPPAPLHRTCSLPVPGADEDYRKRKELQTLKRLEAKRKRSEKRNSLKGDDAGGGACTWQGSGRAGARLPPLSQGSIGSVGSSSSVGGSMQGMILTISVKINNFFVVLMRL